MCVLCVCVCVRVTQTHTHAHTQIHTHKIHTRTDRQTAYHEQGDVCVCDVSVIHK